MENLNNTIIAFYANIGDYRGLYIINSVIYDSLINGEVVLDRKFIPMQKATLVQLAIRKYPFLKPRIILNPKWRLFLKKKINAYYTNERVKFVQAHSVVEIDIIDTEHVYVSETDCIDLASEALFVEYNFERAKLKDLTPPKITAL